MKKIKPVPPERDVFLTSEGQVGYFKMPMEFQMWQSTLSPSAKDIYTMFMIQVRYRNTLDIDMNYELIGYWTGIKHKATIARAIRELAEYGWIRDIKYQKRESNIYSLNLYPKKNIFLIEKMELRRQNTSKAKKKSIANGEGGKFEKGESK